jgi:hypothetical protein
MLLGDTFNRAATLTPSPVRSPSLSSTMSPRWMPTRSSIRRSGRKTRVVLDHAVLYLDGAAYGVYYAPKLNDASIAGSLDDEPVMQGNGWSDQVAPQCTHPRKRSLLVGSGEPAVTDDVGCQNGR